MAVFALHVGAEFLCKLLLEQAHRADGILGHLEGLEQVLLGYFVHLAFHHHDVVFRSTNHDVHVGVLHLFECRVYNVLAVDAGYAYL